MGTDASRKITPKRHNGLPRSRRTLTDGGAGHKQALMCCVVIDVWTPIASRYCFGGATVMQLAYSDPQLRAVISFHGSLPVPDLADASKIRARILVCHGAADAFVPLGKVDAFQTALHKVGVDWQMVSYGGARHSFTNPAADTYGIEGVAYQAAADRRSWKHMQVFLEEAFGSDHDIR